MDKISFYRALREAASAGLSASRAVEILVDECAPGAPPSGLVFRLLEAAGEKIPPLQVSRATLRDLAGKLRGGSAFSDSLARHPGEFQAWELAILKVGERTGRLDDSFGELADILDGRRAALLDLAATSARPMLIQALIPWIVLAPLAYAAGFLVYLGLASAGFLAITPVGAVLFSPKVRRDFQPREMPGFSKMQFSRSLAGLIKAGVGPDEALPLAARAAGNSVHGAGEPGEPFHARLRRCGVFSSEEIGSLRISEECGRLDEGLARLAERARTAWAKACGPAAR